MSILVTMKLAFSKNNIFVACDKLSGRKWSNFLLCYNFRSYVRSRWIAWTCPFLWTHAFPRYEKVSRRKWIQQGVYNCNSVCFLSTFVDGHAFILWLMVTCNKKNASIYLIKWLILCVFRVNILNDHNFCCLQYLSEHGGSSNAFTSAEHTNYYFDVGPEHLSGALDR